MSAIAGTAGRQNRGVGAPENSFAFIGADGRGVRWTELAKDAQRGWKHFWSKRGGAPMQRGRNNFLFGVKEGGR